MKKGRKHHAEEISQKIEVSEIGMGCMGFSHGYGQIPEREYSIRAIREAFEYGCTFFDTAEVYGDVLYYPGHNEQILGEAVEEFRQDIVLATKLQEYSMRTADVVSAALIRFR